MNEAGGFSCRCWEGFSLNSDGKTCTRGMDMIYNSLMYPTLDVFVSMVYIRSPFKCEAAFTGHRKTLLLSIFLCTHCSVMRTAPVLSYVHEIMQNMQFLSLAIMPIIFCSFLPLIGACVMCCSALSLCDASLWALITCIVYACFK